MTCGGAADVAIVGNGPLSPEDRAAIERSGCVVGHGRALPHIESMSFRAYA